MNGLRTVCIVLLFIATGATSFAQSLPLTSPESVGFSQERLDRITAAMNRHVEAGDISGGTGLIARHGKIAYFETYGNQDRESETPMDKDAIFRIYSMSKAITGVAVMMLHEEGKFFLTDPVSKYLPEYTDMKVASMFDGEVQLTDATQQITVRDLLRHTAGITYGGGKVLGPLYRKAGVGGRNDDLEAFSKKLAAAPLSFEPGSTWEYGYSIDVLGRLVEVISGQPFDAFLEERLFAPLGMNDTAFHVPAEKHDRLVTLYSPNENGGIRVATSRAQDSYKEPATFFSGGGGLVSTTMDYARFCQMLLNDGDLDGEQILGRKSVELMRTDHLADIPKKGYLIAADGIGFGLTFAVQKDPGLNGTLDSKGSYRWGGAAGTRFWIDPAEDMFCVFMVNILPYTNLKYGDEFKLLAYQALVD
ncbi:MAG: serine hydrolase [Candidatus Hydrogenedentota bacterium]